MIIQSIEHPPYQENPFPVTPDTKKPVEWIVFFFVKRFQMHLIRVALVLNGFYQTNICKTTHYICFVFNFKSIVFLWYKIGFQKRNVNIHYCTFGKSGFEVQGDFFGTGPKKMRISQRLFIRF